MSVFVVIVPPDRLYDLPAVLTLADMAKCLDLTERTIREQVAAGQFPIPHLEQSDRLRWSRRAVEAWLELVTFTPREKAS